VDSVRTRAQYLVRYKGEQDFVWRLGAVIIEEANGQALVDAFEMEFMKEFAPSLEALQQALRLQAAAQDKCGCMDHHSAQPKV
jgi:hypothetical protein